MKIQIIKYPEEKWMGTSKEIKTPYDVISFVNNAINYLGIFIEEMEESE